MRIRESHSNAEYRACHLWFSALALASANLSHVSRDLATTSARSSVIVMALVMEKR